MTKTAAGKGSAQRRDSYRHINLAGYLTEIKLCDVQTMVNVKHETYRGQKL